MDPQPLPLERLSDGFDLPEYTKKRDVMLTMHADFRRQAQSEITEERDDDEDSET
jgi:hypothetical protein